MINDRYSIIDKIGEGRSKVFSCSDKFNPDTKFVIKILSYTSSEEELKAFQNEYLLLRKLDHPNIIDVYSKGKILQLNEFDKKEFNISENDLFYVMEYIKGISIEQFIEIKKEEVFLQVLDQLVSVLYYIHQSNYVYFDLKPENLLIIESQQEIKVKLIDFGLASYLPELEDEFAKGTAEYIAPEILKNEKPDHRADLYSLGILLYQIAYGKFPFNTSNELEIYHAHLEKNFEFPSCRYSHKCVKVIQKLLEKSPENRYKSVLEIYEDLDRKIKTNTKLQFRNLFQFVEQRQLFENVSEFISNEQGSNILLVEGERGSGKSELLDSINRKYSDSVLINISKFIRNKNFWQQFFNVLIYSDFLYQKIDESLEQYISIHLKDNSDNLLIELKSIFAKISKKNQFILIIDDLEKATPRIIEYFNELFPILQANNIKTILSNSSSESELTSTLENKTEIVLQSFTDEDISALVKHSFQKDFPKEQLIEILLKYSDRNPKNITDLFFNMIVTGIIDFSPKGVYLNYTEKQISRCLEAQEFIYEKIYNDLLVNEVPTLEIISLFKDEISVDIISAVLGISKREVIKIASSLRDKNILRSAKQNINLNFINDGFKKYIYQQIKDAKSLHLETANTLKKSNLAETTTMLIVQYELAESYDLAIQTINEALERENVKTYPRLMHRLLERKSSYELDIDEKIDNLIKIVEVLITLGEFSLAKSKLELLDDIKLDTNQLLNKKKLLGITNINLGELDKGLILLESIIDEYKTDINILLFEMANAQLELNNFDKAEELCKKIVDDEKNDLELLGRVYNLIGLSYLYRGGELSEVKKQFQSAFTNYSKINNLMRIAAIQVNIGNVSYLMGNLNDAEKHWNKALQINESIGNVNQEAKILLNYGVFNYEHSNYENAIKLYKRAGSIFQGLGDKKDYGLVLSNLGETYMAICEYQQCYDSLNESIKIFETIKNDVELNEALILLVKFYWIIGNKPQQKKIISRINENKSDNDINISVQLSFLKQIEATKQSFDQKKVDEFIKIINDSKSLNQKIVAFDIQYILVSILLSNKITDVVYNWVMDEEVIIFAENNSHFEAKRQLILFRLSLIDESREFEDSINYLQKGLEILEAHSITEETISFLFFHTRYYIDRGNIKKASEFGNLYFSMLQYIINNMKASELRNYYLKNERNEKYLNTYKNLQK
ncbi:MAG: protein kinase [Bacteroidota bacterium]